MEISDELLAQLLAQQSAPRPAPARPLRAAFTALCLILTVGTLSATGYILWHRGTVALPLPTIVATPTAGMRTFAGGASYQRPPAAQPQRADALPASSAPVTPPTARPESAPLPAADVVITKYVDSSNPNDQPFIVVQDRANPNSSPILITDGTKRRGTGR